MEDEMIRFIVSLLLATSIFADSNFEISSWESGGDFSPTENILLENRVTGKLRRALPSALEDDMFYLRFKDSQDKHSFFEGYPRADFFKQTYAYKIEDGAHSKWIRTKFYRKNRAQAFTDEVEIYFDKSFIYSPSVPALYYKENGKWEVLTATPQKPGALLIESTEPNTEIYYQGKMIATTPYRTRGYEAGVLNLSLKSPNSLLKSYLLVIKPGEVNEVMPQLVTFQPEQTPTLSTTQYEIPKSTTVDPYYGVLTPLNKELIALNADLERLKVQFDSIYGSTPKPAPSFVDEWTNLEYVSYKESYDQNRKLSYMKFTENFQDRLAYLTQTRSQIKAKMNKIEAEIKTINLKPIAFKWKLLDSAKAQYGLKFKFQSKDGRHDFSYKATSILTPSQSSSLIQDIEKRQADSSQFSIMLQNKAARIPNGDTILNRYYRYQKLDLLYKGEPIPMVGQFKLAPYVHDFPEVQAWLNADEIEAGKRLAQAEAQAKLLAMKRREIEAAQFQALFDQMRGEVVELDSGKFKYNRKQVFLSAYAMMKTEVTQEHFERIMGFNPSKFLNPKKPVHNVSHEQAHKFCKTVGGNLPTEAQWEYAARAGTNTYFFWGERAKDATPYAIFADNSFNEGAYSSVYGPAEVASKRPNPWGFYDVAGNVSEWTLDFDGLFSFSFFTSSRNPKGLDNTLNIWHERIFKGGSWRDEKKTLEHRKSDYEDPRYWGDMIGFRCVYPSHQTRTKEEIVKVLDKHKKKLEAKRKVEKAPIVKDTLNLDLPAVKDSVESTPKAVVPDTANSKSINPKTINPKTVDPKTPQPKALEPQPGESKSVEPKPMEPTPPKVSAEPAPKAPAPPKAPEPQPVVIPADQAPTPQ